MMSLDLATLFTNTVTIEPTHDVSESEHSILINFSNKRTYSKLSVVTTGLLDISKNKSTFV